jgi:3',5'-cyclic AMP phosphodiesterase CpdA/tetratricopeptide (TPR) repeat protein
MPLESLTVLHISDLQFGRNHRFGQLGLADNPDAELDTLFKRLSDDLDVLASDVKPELVVVSGDLVEWGLKREFEDALEFLVKLSEHTKIPRDRFIIVPGNHDINRKLCEAYFVQCDGEESTPQPPYWPKWKPYKFLFDEFYAGHDSIQFTEEEPWTLFRIESLKVVIAGLNSTIVETHADETHYGWVGERQVELFAKRLSPFASDGWLRIGVVHHNLQRGAVTDDENLKDRDTLERGLGSTLNLVMHGHRHEGRLEWLRRNTPIVSTGSAALKQEQRPEEVGNQYQIVRLTATRIERWLRRYDPVGKRWIGDTRSSQEGNDWHLVDDVTFENVQITFSSTTGPTLAGVDARVVEIEKPIDAETARMKLHHLPRFRLRTENQHRVIRKQEQELFGKIIQAHQAIWLVSDWGLGKEGFLAGALELAGGEDALKDVFRLHCGGVNSCDELLAEAETQLGLSFQEFAAAVAAVPSATLVFDDLPPAIVVGAERSIFEQKIRPIFDFCPELKLVFVARQEPTNTDPTEIVTLTALDVEDTRKYLRNHTQSQPEVSDADDFEQIHAWSSGLPMHLDRLLERFPFVPLADILNDDAEIPSAQSSEPLPESLRKTVTGLKQSDVKRSRQSFELLKVLTILRDGETFQSIRRFYVREPFYQSNIDELVESALLEDISISQTTLGLGLPPRLTGLSKGETPKLLRVPRQVRDFVNSLISDEERDDIIATSTGLFFGPAWYKGKVRLRNTLTNAYSQSGIVGPGNEHVVARHLLAKALEKNYRPRIDRFAQLALAYCHRLIGADRFRDTAIAAGAITDLLRSTKFDEHFVDAAHIYARSLRMIGRELEAIEILKEVLQRGAEFLIDENKASVHLSLALAYDDLDRSEDAVESAGHVLKLSHLESGVSYQAQAIIAATTLKGAKREQKLIELEKTARNKDRVYAANNIALNLASEGKNFEQSLVFLERVIRTARDNYNRTRAIIQKANLLQKHGRQHELTMDDRDRLAAAYSYSYAQRIGNLLNRCHKVLWSIFSKEGLVSSLLRLFRYSSFIWRLRGTEEQEEEYVTQLRVVDVEELKQREGGALRMEIIYLERRRLDYQ